MFKVLNKKSKAPSTKLHTKKSKMDNLRLSREWRNIEILSEIARGDYSNAQQFSGFGGLYKELQNQDVQEALMDIVTADQWESLRKSTSTAYYTPPDVIRYCWQIAQKLGFSGGDILEPTCGIGAFFDHMPDTIREQSSITGIELEKVSAHIATALHDDIEVVNGGFQHHQGEYDLVIGNPPYATFGVNDRYFPELNDLKIHHAFLARSIKLLHDGGLCIMIVPSYCLDSSTNHARDIISQEADLLYSYRLPDGIWTDAKVSTDLVVFHKTQNPQGNWQGITQVELDCGYRDYISDYYIEHPEHLLGSVDKYEAWLSKEQRKRQGLTISGSIGDVRAKLPKLIDGIEPIYTEHQRADKGRVIDFKHKDRQRCQISKKADTLNYEKVIARLDGIGEELARIRDMLASKVA